MFAISVNLSSGQNNKTVSLKMLANVVCVILVILSVVVFGADLDCITPNGEVGKCIDLSSCKITKDAVLTGNKDAVKFALKSQCGNDTKPLVCCGSYAYKIAGSLCTTPNGESATCKPLASCRVILQAVVSLNRDAIEFARRSQCTNDKTLVCCGTEGNYSPITSTNISPLLPNRTTCGLAQAFRVFGGQITEISEYPWTVLLRYQNLDGTDAGYKCGGTVINNRYVLTAAHCVLLHKRERFKLYSVRLGEWRISTDPDCEEDEKGSINEECAESVVDLQIEKRSVHPKYHRSNKKNDIALLRLERNVKYTDYIRPICLPEPQSSMPTPGTKLVVVGWGSTENNSNSDYKLKAEVPIVSRSDCEAHQVFDVQITENQICAGGTLRKDSCRGDSGGPLMGTYAKQSNEQDQWYQEGIVSWGIGCGVLGRPAIYTRVSMYVQWIGDNLKEF